MNLYLDDDSASRLLARLLRQAGHHVQVPMDVFLPGASDPIHLMHAIRESHALITGNHDDFQELHDLIAEAGSHQSGIIVIRKENNPRRDMTHRGIVRAIANLAESLQDLTDQFVILNHWR